MAIGVPDYPRLPWTIDGTPIPVAASSGGTV